jgi:hypothetical protein
MHIVSLSNRSLILRFCLQVNEAGKLLEILKTVMPSEADLSKRNTACREEFKED